MLVVKALLSYHWGFSVRKPFFSAQQPTFRVPPPTTLMGALARAFASASGWPETFRSNGGLFSSAARLYRACPWATAAIVDENVLPSVGPVETRDVMRAVIAHYLRRENVEPGAVMFAPQPHGKVYAPGFKLLAAFLFTDDGEAREASRLAWSICAVGCKESLVSVEDVRLLSLDRVSDRLVETRFYFEKALARKGPATGFIEEDMTMPSSEHYQVARVKVNVETCIVPLGPVRVEVAEDKALVLRDEEGDCYIISKDRVGGLGA